MDTPNDRFFVKAVIAALGLGLLGSPAGCWLDRTPLKSKAGTGGNSSGVRDGASELDDASNNSDRRDASVGYDASGAGGNAALDASVGRKVSDGGPSDGKTQDVAASFPGSCAGFHPVGGDCPSVCSSCENNNTCIFNCAGIGPLGGCMAVSATCPTGWACKLKCVGTAACMIGTLVCSDGPCSAECLGIGACSAISVVCGSDACSSTCDSIASPGMLTLTPGNSCKVTSGCP
jgi:hypothetical protein